MHTKFTLHFQSILLLLLFTFYFYCNCRRFVSSFKEGHSAGGRRVAAAAVGVCQVFVHWQAALQHRSGVYNVLWQVRALSLLFLAFSSLEKSHSRLEHLSSFPRGQNWSQFGEPRGRHRCVLEISSFCGVGQLAVGRWYSVFGFTFGRL